MLKNHSEETAKAQRGCSQHDAEQAQANRERLLLHSPFHEEAGIPATGFLGIWSPNKQLSVELVSRGTAQPSMVCGPNWLLAAPPPLNGMPFYVHKEADSGLALAFRGYVSSPLLDHNSRPERILDYWRSHYEDIQNGVFAVARIDEQKQSLRLRTDAFGLAPLYYRMTEHCVLFATNPDYLSTPDDKLDDLAAFSLMLNGLITGNASLNADAKRVPLGTDVTFEHSVRPCFQPWFAFDDLPECEQPLDEPRLKMVEDTLAASVTRCARMGGGQVFLPLSSGHDSRRILAQLLQDKTPVKTATVRIFQKGDRDLDATFARRLADMFGLDHQVFDLPNPSGYAQDDARRRYLLGEETHMHTWALSMMRHVSREPSVLLDGGLGDILGNPGIRLPGLYKNLQADTQQLVAYFSPGTLKKYVSKDFHQIEALGDAIMQYIKPFAHRRNITEYGAMLQRQRRAILLGPQQLAPPSAVVALPHADLDYIRATVRIRPEERHASPLQGACLQRFHPRLATVPGSRDIPESVKPSGEKLNRQHRIACIRKLLAEQPHGKRQGAMNGYLSGWGHLIIEEARLSGARNQRWAWFVQPALEVLLHGIRQKPVWQWVG